jgi:hypothetical protein
MSCDLFLLHILRQIAEPDAFSEPSFELRRQTDYAVASGDEEYLSPTHCLIVLMNAPMFASDDLTHIISAAPKSAFTVGQPLRFRMPYELRFAGAGESVDHEPGPPIVLHLGSSTLS